jgi:hypothetical protein
MPISRVAGSQVSAFQGSAGIKLWAVRAQHSCWRCGFRGFDSALGMGRLNLLFVFSVRLGAVGGTGINVLSIFP